MGKVLKIWTKKRAVGKRNSGRKWDSKGKYSLVWWISAYRKGNIHPTLDNYVQEEFNNRICGFVQLDQ